MNALAAAPVTEAGASEARALAFLADLSQTLAVSLDLRETIDEAVVRIADFMQAEAASLFLLNDDGSALECRVCYGPVDLTGMRIEIGQGVVGRSVAENRALISANAQVDDRVDRAADEASGFVTRSLVCVPLATARGPIGALEVVNKRDGSVFGPADAEILRLVAAPTALAINNARMAHELIEQVRLKREFALARRLQKSLLPKRRRDAFPVLGVNLPAHEISGDFYDYFDLPDGRVGFFVGDVSGKGLDAALLMVRAASLLRWIGKDGTPPAEWLARANDDLCRTALDGRFVCALVGQCERDGGNVHFAGAGFPPALLHRDEGFTEYPSGGPPLGILPGIPFEPHALELGDGTLYCFSDGVTDVRDAARRTIGEQGVRELVTRHAGSSSGPRLRAMLGELKRMRLVDDTTLLLVERPSSRGHEVLLERRFPARPQAMRELRAALRGALDGAGIESGLRDRLVLAVDEACCNIIRHAYGDACAGDIDVRVLSEGNQFEFRLLDTAPVVDPACVKPKPLGEERAGGLGVALIDAVMDEWSLQARPDGRGNRLVMRKRVEARNQSGDDNE